MEIKIRLAQLEDAQRVWEIRNDPKARANSGNQEVIPLANHIKWFDKKYSKQSGNFCFVGELDYKVIGYCRFDIDDTGYTVSIAVDPAIHGKGIGTTLLAGSIEKLKSEKPLHATVKKDNIASVKIFERNEFKLASDDTENFYYEL